MVQRSILVLSPQVYGAPGGVQAYLRRLREILTAYSKLRGFRVHFLSLVDAREERNLHRHSVLSTTFEGCAGKKLTFVLKALGHVIRRDDSVVVVGHLGQAPVAWGLKSLGVIRSYVLVIYGIEAWGKAAGLDGRAARGATRVVAITQFTAREFWKHNGVPYDRFRIIPPALAEEEINLPARKKMDSSGLRVLTVGRLSMGDRPKGIDTLIKAVGNARNNGVKVHLTVIGDGDDLQRLRGMAVSLGLDGQVEFLGAVLDDRLQQLYQECDVFAMPSKKEGFGIVFLEAMRFAKPCIGGNHGGTPEIIDHGIDGYLVHHADVEQLARYLIEFSQEPEVRWKIGLRGYDKVKAGYLFPHMRNRWFNLLDELNKC